VNENDASQTPPSQHTEGESGMSRWAAVAILGDAQFLMVLDSTVMNVSISAVMTELDTSVEAIQGAITVYSLTMAALMLLGAKLGDVIGRRRMFVIGAIVHGVGSLLTTVAPTFAILFLGWSVIEGLGAVAVIPAIAALVANNHQGVSELPPTRPSERSRGSPWQLVRWSEDS